MKVSGGQNIGYVSNSQPVCNNQQNVTNSINYFDSHNPLASLAYMHARNSKFPNDNVGKNIDFMG